MADGRVIFHIDMNSFFASCEIAENPALKGLKICIAHDTLDKKGVVVAASYEAKKDGVHAPLPLYKVLELCPDIIVVEPHYEYYEEYNEKIFDYFYSLTNLVEPASIDEGYLDVTGLVPNNEYVEFAKQIQDHILNELNIPCSIGIGPNKFLAKMASDMKKPLGITVLRKKDIPTLLWPLPIEDMFGAGIKTCEALHSIGIKTIGELANYQRQDVLTSLLGENSATSLVYHANGGGSNVIDTQSYYNTQSLSHSITLDHDVFDIASILLEEKLLINHLIERLEKHNMAALNIGVTLKFNNFKRVSKCITLDKPTNKYLDIVYHARSITEELFTGENGVRLICVYIGKLSEIRNEERQLSMFDELDQETLDLEVNKTINSINDLFGGKTLIKGTKNIHK